MKAQKSTTFEIASVAYSMWLIAPEAASYTVARAECFERTRAHLSPTYLRSSEMDSNKDRPRIYSAGDCPVCADSGAVVLLKAQPVGPLFYLCPSVWRCLGRTP